MVRRKTSRELPHCGHTGGSLQTSISKVWPQLSRWKSKMGMAVAS